jgi:hypothetical protein
MKRVDDAEVEAQKLLDVTWRWRQPPIDPIYIARQLGFKVFTAGLSTGVASLIRNRPGYDPDIYLNTIDSYNRQRWSAARELGFYIHRLADAQTDWAHLSARDVLTTPGNVDEVYASVFAAHLLMPTSALECLRGLSLLALAETFRVPVEIIHFRLTAHTNDCRAHATLSARTIVCGR